jgi:hypothetical protein
MVNLCDQGRKTPGNSGPESDFAISKVSRRCVSEAEASTTEEAPPSQRSGKVATQKVDVTIVAAGAFFTTLYHGLS